MNRNAPSLLYLSSQKINVIRGAEKMRTMKNGIIAVYILLFVCCGLFLISSLSFGHEVPLTMIYTSNTLGEIEPSC